MTIITLEQTLPVLASLSQSELRNLSQLKALELLFGFSSEIDQFGIAKKAENLVAMREIWLGKSDNFFGYEVSVKGENLQLIVGFMAQEFRKGKTADFYRVDRKICAMCYKDIFAELPRVWQKAANRLMPMSATMAKSHIQRQAEAEMLEELVNKIGFGEVTIIVL